MRPKPKGRILALVVVVTVALLAFVLHYVPFNAPSFLAWIGIAAALAGLVSVARPLRFLGVRTRWHALALALCGAGVAATALLWPAPLTRSARPHQRLDDFLPAYQFSEVHETRVRAPVEAVVRAMRQVSTETRCLANGAEERRVFARYWRIIYPGSAIIRRVWLDAIAARAVRSAGGPGRRGP